MAYYPYSPNFTDRYVLTNSDGISAVFNDTLDPSYVAFLTEVTGLDSADVRESADELVEADGGQHGYFWLGRRPIVLNGRVTGHATVQQRAARLDLARRASLALRADSTLSWKPKVRNENLVTNPRAMVDTAGWSSASLPPINSGATLTRVTGIAPAVGTTGFQVATSGAGNANQGATWSFTPVAGQTYAISIQAKRVTGTGTYDLVVQGGGSATNTFVTGASAGAFTTYTTTFTATTTATVYIALKSSNSNTLASTFQFSDVLVAPGTNTAYSDGDTTGWYWQGNAGQTASGDYIEMYTPVRRQQPWRESGGWNKDFQCALVSQFAPIMSAQQKSVSAALAVGASVENRGNYAGYPVVQITGGNLANPTVTRTGGEVFTTNGTGLTIASGETLEVDFLNHTARFIAGARNGQSGNRYIAFSTTAWPSLPTDINTLTLGGTGSGSMVVLWRDTWA